MVYCDKLVLFNWFGVSYAAVVWTVESVGERFGFSSSEFRESADVGIFDQVKPNYLVIYLFIYLFWTT